MPLHEYRCTSCGHCLEVLQRFNAAPLRECPQCGGALIKLISAPALQFKGSGFYLTDYGRAGGGRQPESDAGKSESAGDKATPSESKPAGDTKPAAESKSAADSKPTKAPAKAAS